MIETLINMGLSGSFIVGLWYLIFFGAKGRLSVIWHYYILKSALLFTLLPIGEYGAKLISNSKILTIPTLAYNGNITLYPIKVTVSNAVIQYIIIIWAIGAFAILSYKIYCYHKLNRYILKNSVEVINPSITKVFFSCKENAGIKYNVAIKKNSFVGTPLVTGILKPTIILPDQDMTTEELEYVFFHELYHIKNKDLWFRLLALLSLIIHWYNPFVYLLGREIKEFSELCCDGEVVKRLSLNERRSYGMLILKTVSEANTLPCELYATLRTKSNIKRRLYLMLKFKSMKTSMRIISTVLGVLVLSCSITLTSYASSVTNRLSVIEHSQNWLSPFSYVETKIYDLGDGFTAKSTTTSVTKIASVNHKDEKYFSKKQWSDILRKIDEVFGSAFSITI